jgi:polyisoprenoid-binding protein YceI
MKKIFLLLGLVAIGFSADAQMLKSKSTKISFFSKTPVEDIDAKSEKATAAIDPVKRAIAFRIPINSFVFKDKLMQDHFNENYMESEKYPVATYEGKIQETIDLSKDGIYNVTVVGNMVIHGVSKSYTTKGTIAVKGGAIIINSTFKVKLEDHKIKVPKVVVANIAEIIDVTVNAGFQK